MSYSLLFNNINGRDQPRSASIAYFPTLRHAHAAPAICTVKVNGHKKGVYAAGSNKACVGETLPGKYEPEN